MAERIVVTPQYLREKQEEWTAFLGQAQEAFLMAVLDTEEIRQYFWGKPVRKLQKEVVSVKKEGMEAFGRMKAHLGKLEKIASVYEDAERSNVNATADH